MKDKIAFDFFCGVGGVTRTLQDKGYNVYGFDYEKQSKNPAHEFVKLDLRKKLPLKYRKMNPDLVWASPPCQFATAIRFQRSGDNLIPRARELVNLFDSPYIIENVPGGKDHLKNPIMLCGSIFDLDIRKHRYFETSFNVDQPNCKHKPNESFKFSIGGKESPVTEYRKAHGFSKDSDLTTKELRECIPKPYVKYLILQGGLT